MHLNSALITRAAYTLLVTPALLLELVSSSSSSNSPGNTRARLSQADTSRPDTSRPAATPTIANIIHGLSSRPEYGIHASISSVIFYQECPHPYATASDPLTDSAQSPDAAQKELMALVKAFPPRKEFIRHYTAHIFMRFGAKGVFKKHGGVNIWRPYKRASKPKKTVRKPGDPLKVVFDGATYELQRTYGEKQWKVNDILGAGAFGVVVSCSRVDETGVTIHGAMKLTLKPGAKRPISDDADDADGKYGVLMDVEDGEEEVNEEDGKDGNYAKRASSNAPFTYGHTVPTGSPASSPIAELSHYSRDLNKPEPPVNEFFKVATDNSKTPPVKDSKPASSFASYESSEAASNVSKIEFKEFDREVTALRAAAGSATKPNRFVPKLLEVYTQDPQFLVMVLEKATNGDLEDFVEAKGPISESDARVYLKQLYQGMSNIEANGVSMNDLKPKNILLTRSGKSNGSLEIRITDFGRAYFHSETVTRASGLCGDVDVETPERWNAYFGPIDANMRDVFQIGAIAYYMLHGSLPLRSKKASRVVFASDKTLLMRDDLSAEMMDFLQQTMWPDSNFRMTMESMAEHPVIKNVAPQDNLADLIAFYGKYGFPRVTGMLSAGTTTWNPGYYLPKGVIQRLLSPKDRQAGSTKGSTAVQKAKKVPMVMTKQGTWAAPQAGKEITSSSTSRGIKSKGMTITK